MMILVANDDGIYAPGIKFLAENLGKDHEVYIVAPDKEYSGTGCAITLYSPLRVKEMPEGFFKNIKKAWKVSGTPADSVKMALAEILPQKPDIIISGINKGANLGNDIFYSGTVAAAFEGANSNIRSISVSMTSTAEFNELYYINAIDFIKKMIEIISSPNTLPLNVVLNINVPTVLKEEIKGFKFTKLGVRKYKDSFEKRIDLRGGEYYWISADLLDMENGSDTDVIAVKENYISVTPIHSDLTYYSVINKLKEIELDFK